jgi:ABC-type multidrug transport system fused ATPase/permease subunit
VARLLQRFYDPTRGRITLDGHDLRDATLEQVRHHVGVVSQDVHLFHATVRDNLTVYAGGVPDDTLVCLLREVGLGAWYARLDTGLDTVLPPGGGGVSAGEAQLLAAVRVFVADPGLVILDEPTSRLDPATEALVQKAFDRLLRDRTGIMIAHRLGTLRRVDTLMVLSGGRIVEYGPRLELEADPRSAYHRTLALARGEPEPATPLPSAVPATDRGSTW